MNEVLIVLLILYTCLATLTLIFSMLSISQVFKIVLYLIELKWKYDNWLLKRAVAKGYIK